MTVPPGQFARLLSKWNEDIGKDLDCKTDPTFCTADKSCAELTKVLKPVSFLMSDTIFELQPMQYLYQANGENKCYFVLSEGKLGGKNKDIYLLGAAFLKHYYSVFDFDNNQISLGINTHSQGKVSMKPSSSK